MVRNSCQNSTVGSIANPLISGWGDSSAISDMSSSSWKSWSCSWKRSWDCLEVLETNDDVSSCSDLWWLDGWEFDTTECDRTCAGVRTSKAVELCAAASSVAWGRERGSGDLVRRSLLDSTPGDRFRPIGM